MGLYNRFCKRFFAAVIFRLTARSDSRAHKIVRHVMETVDEKKNTYFLAGPALYGQGYFGCKLPSSPELSSR